MKRFVQILASGVVFLLLGMSTLTAQEVAFQAGPSISLPLAPNNGGFAWGDVNGDGYLDVFTRPNNMMINQVSAFSVLATAALPIGSDAVGVALADFNGDGLPDVLEVGQTGNIPILYLDSIGVSFRQVTATGDLATAGGAFNNFGSVVLADYNRDGNLDIAWAGTHGIWLLKGGSSGTTFTNAGNMATPSNLAIDTTRRFESWNSNFLDANNDGYPDLLVGGFRNGFAQFDKQVGDTLNSAIKGSILYMNKGDGTFFVPNATTLSRPIYEIDSISAGVIYAGTKVDTGIIVDDTVRHFESIAHTHGDFNNDGIEDLVLLSNSANNIDGLGVSRNVVILYGKGDGTFTYKYGASVVASNGLPQNGNIRAMDAGDYNNDTKLDILVAGNGVSSWLYRNNGDGTFTDVTSDGVVVLGGVVRSAGFVDYNNDGFLDIFAFSGSASSPFNSLQMNRGNSNKWIGFKPLATGNNKSAIGARFTLYAGGLKQIRTIRADGNSEGIGGGLWANFGLGATTKVDSLQVGWPDGTKQTFVMGAANNTLAVNKYYLIQENSIIPSAPTTIRPSWAANDTSLASIDTLKWHKVVAGAGATTYQVQVASNLSFSSIVKTVSSLSDTSTIVRLGLSTKYYWRVQSLDNQLPSPYSAIDSFRTKIAIDSIVPTQLLPVNKSTTVAAVNPKLVVSFVSTASTYHFQLRSDSATGFTKTTGFLVNDSTSDFDTTWTITTALTPSQKYYWRVRGYNPAGSSAFSPVDTFTVMYLPAAPTLVYPTVNQPNVSISPSLTLKWNHVAGDSNYIAQLWRYSSLGQILMADTTKHDTSWTISSGLMSREQYFWKVLSFNQGGAGPFSAIDSFTTVTEIPSIPQPVTPNPSALSDMRARFVWNPVANALKYHIQVAPDNAFATIREDITVEDTTVLISDTLVANTDYYWHVSASNLGGESAFSNAVHFKTNNKVSVDQLGNVIPKVFALEQNYPNPFNPSTTIRYDIPKESYVKLVIYDVLGRTVATLVDGVQSANRYIYQWNPRGLSTGVYIYRIHAKSQDGSGEFTAVKKLLFMK